MHTVTAYAAVSSDTKWSPTKRAGCEYVSLKIFCNLAFNT